MVVYNISVKVDNAIGQDWLIWQQKEHIPENLATGLFRDCRMFRLLGHDDEDSSTYVIQYSANSRQQYDEYILMHAESLQQKEFKKWGNLFIAFRSLMQKVNYTDRKQY